MSWQKIDSIEGHMFTKIDGMERSQQVVTMYRSDGAVVRFEHEQDCCENVEIDDVSGDVADLIGVPIISAYESSLDTTDDSGYDCALWTFYHFTTNKGTVVLRWLGTSNGYYSMGVNITVVPSLIADLS